MRWRDDDVLTLALHFAAAAEVACASGNHGDVERMVAEVSQGGQVLED